MYSLFDTTNDRPSVAPAPHAFGALLFSLFTGSLFTGSLFAWSAGVLVRCLLGSLFAVLLVRCLLYLAVCLG
jgi:hypothetical protein